MELLIIITLLVIAAETTFLVGRIASQGQIFNNATRKYVKPIFVDTSVLIDGRIISVAQSGFITGTLLIPRSVVGELQLLADQADHDRRARARRGLDLVNELLALTQVRVEVYPDETPAREGVDARLLKLAAKHKGAICTIDYNLNKVAQVEGITVLNVNDLAMNLRMAYLPGEKVMLELTQKGNESHQAVGHLADGTMVVVEQGGTRLGQRVEIEFIRSLQTAAGKMMFARIVADGAAQKTAGKPLGQKRQPAKARKSPENAIEKAPEAVIAQEPVSVTPTEQDAPRASQQQRPRRQQEQRNQPSRSSQPSQSNRQAQPQRRRRNNEDSLIELANKIGE